MEGMAWECQTQGGILSTETFNKSINKIMCVCVCVCPRRASRRASRERPLRRTPCVCVCVCVCVCLCVCVPNQLRPADASCKLSCCLVSDDSCLSCAFKTLSCFLSRACGWRVEKGGRRKESGV